MRRGAAADFCSRFFASCVMSPTIAPIPAP
jgi:hypothetical protein